MSTMNERLDELNKQMNRALEASDKALYGPKAKKEPIETESSESKVKKKFVPWKLERKR